MNKKNPSALDTQSRRVTSLRAPQTQHKRRVTIFASSGFGRSIDAGQPAAVPRRVRRHCGEGLAATKNKRLRTDSPGTATQQLAQQWPGTETVLTRPQRDRGHKLVGTFVARPRVADAASQIESGFLGDQQNAAARRAFGSAKIVRYQLRSVASDLHGHRRSSATVPVLQPRSAPVMGQGWTKSVARLRRDYETLVAHRRRFLLKYR